MRRARVSSRLFVFAIGLALVRAADAQFIDTVAGGGPNNFQALAVNLGALSAVTVDGARNRFIASTGDDRIYKVDEAGRVTVFAGTGIAGSVGENVPATGVSLGDPSGVAVDAAGDLFIADRSNRRIRRVDAETGLISTSMSFGLPSGIAFDVAGNLFAADPLNHRVWRVDAVTRQLTSVAGNGTPGFSGDGGAATAASLRGPSALALDSAGNLFIADQVNQRIRRVDGATRIITTVAGSGRFGFGGDGGPATRAQLYSPSGVALDAEGNLFIADRLNQRIRRVDAVTGIISTLAGNGLHPARRSRDGDHRLRRRK
jgi:sugar lactone lactonase YvrE